jgi:hypothetical protein
MAGFSLFAVAAAGAAAAELDPGSIDLGRFRRDTSTFAVDRGTLPAGVAPALDRSARILPAERGFYQGYLLPRLTTQFTRLSPYRVLPSTGAARDEFVLFDEVTGAAQRRAERGVSRAVRHYLLETTSIGRWIDAFGTESTRTLGGQTRSSAFRTGFGISHGLPRFDMRYQAGNTILRLGAGVDRSVGFELRRNLPGSATAVSAKYNRDERAYSMGCRISF